MSTCLYTYSDELLARDDLITHLDISPGDVQSTGMGQSGCDLYLSPAARVRFPYGVECKHQETLAVPEWWRQCSTNAAKAELTPLLLIKRSREEPLAVLRWADLLEILTKTNPCEISSSGDDRP